MAFQYTIKKCIIFVDRKKYTKNEINIGNNLMFISYSNPGKYNGRVMVSLKNPDENVSKVLLNSRLKILEFNWTGLWEDETTGKEVIRILKIITEEENSVNFRTQVKNN